ncbi:MAG TPA: oxidoreductase [Pseudonocardia sp.]|jgi:NAD(P)-dependent dehydrogenase (short-subunit alcohol dehydrogenase family)|nr:oxidoreductase [Pseudonocardia sp.]
MVNTPLAPGAQAGRTFVITGASGGLGLATARPLVLAGARVVLAVRNVEAGRRAAATLARTPESPVPRAPAPQAPIQAPEVRELDLASLASIHRFADGWTGPIDVLVNNAGVANVPLGRTEDGFERQVGTNHLGHFALTNLLLPRLTDRVVTVASTAHRSAELDLDDLNWTHRPYRPMAAYARSKLANLLFTLELQRRLTAVGSPVRALAAHPGVAASDLNRNLGPAMALLDRTLGRLIRQSSEAGAEPTLAAATSDLPGGSYLGPDGPREQRGRPTLVGRSALASDPELAARLWTLSTELTAVDFTLPVAA